MVGRYINHDGKQFDRPVVRFGNLAMLPEPIHQRERAFDQESLLVDMRSVVGFSGSLVTLYYEVSRVRMSRLEARPEGPPLSSMVATSAIGEDYWVLGIDWGHLSVREDIIDEGERRRVKVKSSMAAVVPAWKLKEMVDTVDEIVKPREEAEAELAKVNPNDAVLDVGAEGQYDRFEALAKQIVKVPKAEIDGKRKQ
jgi:hypothetical protein